ncbi:hypothetical protein EDC04DRAFT_698981 [Pisolithus marmoratus]|nr:hypothetical protein EDC04DRAFT_698981 [Pisolithus marmoratus]
MRSTVLCFFVASLLSVVAGVAVGSSSWSFSSLAQKGRCTPAGKFCPGYGEANCCSGECNVLRGPGFVRIGICTVSSQSTFRCIDLYALSPSNSKYFRFVADTHIHLSPMESFHDKPLRISWGGKCFVPALVYTGAYL